MSNDPLLQHFIQENELEAKISHLKAKFKGVELENKLNQLFAQYSLSPELEAKLSPTSAENVDVNPLQILVLNLRYDSFKGKMASGRISSGKVAKNMNIVAISENNILRGRVTALMIFDGLGMKEVEEAEAGEIVMIAGLENIQIGDTITTPEYNQPLARVKVDEPTIKMTFGVNTSPFAGREGKFTTSRQIRERLYKELETNVALRVEDHAESSEKFVVSGRGELHLAVLIETMRREGFELEVSRPEVIFKTREELGI